MKLTLQNECEGGKCPLDEVGPSLFTKSLDINNTWVNDRSRKKRLPSLLLLQY